MGRIKYLVMDVDGTLTDGKIYMGQDGEMCKAFDIKDGCGIFLVLPKYDIKPVIITARESQIVQNRCAELNITELYQGVKDKLAKLREVVDDDLNSVAYAGDDLPDIRCMEAVKSAGGLVLSPANAIPEIKAMADYVSGYKAGDGAIRDSINYLIQYENQDVEERVRRVVDAILSGEYSDGFINGNPYFIQEYQTKEESDCILESHRRHIDVQYMIEGREEFKVYSSRGLTSGGEYDADKDTDYWQDGIIESQSILLSGSLIVVYNGQPHKCEIKIGNTETVKKLVCKIVM